MNNDNINIRVKYIPDTSGLRNIKELKAPEIKIGGKNIGKNIFESYNAAVRDLNKEMSKGANASTMLKGFKNIEAEASKAKIQINNMIDAINKSFQSPGNQALIKDYENLIKQSKKLEEESKKRRAKTSELSQYKSQTKMSTPQARKEISKADALVATGEKLTKQDQERLDIAKQIIAKEEELAKLRTQEEIRSAQRNVKAQMEDPRFVAMFKSEDAAKANNELAESNAKLALSYNYVTKGVNESRQAQEKEKEVVKEAKEEVVKFGDVISGTFLGTSLSNLFQTGLKRGIEFFKDYDEILTRTMMVSGMSREEVNKLTSSYNELATKLTSTTQAVADAQLVFYQQGLSTNEALKMTQASIAISKTGGIESGEAANRLTAALRGYQLSANEAMNIADKMSALDAAAASSVDELTVAMQKSASQARMAGLDLDYYMAYLSTMQEVTREAPENIGTAMKSITSRLQEIKDIGSVEEDGTTFSNVAKALNSIGIAALDSSGQLRSLQDIMNDLGPVWQNLDRNHQAYIATVLAGNRQQSRFIALMDNYDRALELVTVSQNAAGESSKQMRAYNQGLEAAFIRLSNAWQQFATKVVDSTTIAKFIDRLTSLIEWVNKLPSPLIKATSGLWAMNKAIKAYTAIKNISWTKSIGKLFGIDTSDSQNQILGLSKVLERLMSAFKSGGQVAKNFFTSFSKDSKNIDSVTSAVETNTNSINKNNDSKLTEQEIMESNNSTHSNEVTELDAIEKSQKDLSNATADTNKQIKEQSDLYENNFDEVIANYNNIAKEYEKQKSQLYAQLKGPSGAEAAKEKAFADYEKRMAAASEAYHSAILPDSLKQMAIGQLEKEGIFAPSGKYRMNLGSSLEEYIIENGETLDEYEELLQNKISEIYSKLGAAYHEQQEEIGYDLDASLVKINEWAEKKTDKIKKLNESKKKILREKKEYEEGKAQKTQEESGEQVQIPTNVKNLYNDLKSIGKDVIFKPMIVKTITEMVTSMIGLSDETSKVVAGFVSMGYAGLKAGKQIQEAMAKSGKKMSNVQVGIVAAISTIVGGLLSWGSTLNDITVINDKLNKVLEQRDTVAEDVKGLESNLETYKEISKQVVKTEEEQSQLNTAANNLASILPEIVSGYDSAGNAIVDAVVAQEKLNKLKEKELKYNNQAITLYDKKIGKEGKANVFGNMANVAPSLIAAGASIGSVVSPGAGTAVGALIGTIATGLVGVGSAIFNAVTESKNLKEALIENRDEVLSLLNATTEVPEGMEGLKATIINSIFEQGYEEGFGPNEMARKIKEITNKINSNVLDVVLSRFKIQVQDPHLDTTEMKKTIISELKKIGFSDEQIELIYDGVVSIIWGGEINVSAIDDKLEEYIKGDYSKALKKGAQEIINLESRLKKELYSSGLLTEDMLEYVFSGMTAQEINDAFYSSGAYDAFGGLKSIIWETYSEIGDNLNWQETASAAVEGWEKAINETTDKINELKSKFIKSKGFFPRLGNLEEMGEEQIKTLKDRIKKDESLSEEERQLLLDYIDTSKALKEYNLALKSNKEYLVESEKETQALQATMETLANSLAKETTMPSFSKMSTEINEAIAPLKSLNSALKEIYELDGNITFDSLGNLLDSLQSIQDMVQKAGLSTEYFNQACLELANGLSIENGMMHLNIDSTKLMQEVAVAGYKAQINAMADKIQASIDVAETEKSILEKEIEFLKTKVLNAEDGAEAESIIENDLADFMKDIHVQEVENTKQQYADQLIAASAYANKLANIMSAIGKGEMVDEDEITNAFKALTKNLGKEIQSGVGPLADNPKWKDSVNKYINSLEIQKKDLADTIKGQYALKEKLMALAKSDNLDLGKMLGNGLDDANDSLDEYIGKLERTFNLIQKIDRLAHQISDNANLKDLYKNYDGEKYAKSLMTELGLSKEQYEYRKKLFQMEQEELGKQRGRIEDSPYASLFSFDSNDLIQIDWDKYETLSGQDQEEIDTLIDRYEELQDAVESTEIEMAEYAKTVQQAWQEIENTIISAENTIVDAIKNREKILHEARQKALDDEISMIEKAVEARNKAREKEDQGKELYKAQEALRRATLDSSGKNNAQLLQLQQDLEDKQLEIADKRFEEDMNDRKQWLQDTKDAETETYEYRLETMTKFWEEAQEIMNSGTENIMNFLIMWDEKYRTESQTQRDQTARGWQIMYDQIQELYNEGFDLNTFYSQMQEITDDLAVQEINIHSIATAWEAATKAANTYKASIPNTYRAGIDNNPPGNDPDPTPDSGKVGDYTPDYPASAFDIGQKVKTKENFGFVTVYQAYENKDTGEYRLTGQKDWRPVIAGESFTIKKKFYDKKSGQWYYNNGGNYFWKGLQLKKYAAGGMVDYTGPAWVDGNKSRPEAFLSAYQTEQIGALAKALDTSTINNAIANSTVTFGSINFNVASMSSAADGRKALDIFVQGANDMMAKKGIGTKLNLNVK